MGPSLSPAFYQGEIAAIDYMIVNLTSIQSDYLYVNLSKEREDLYEIFLSSKIDQNSFELEIEIIREIQNWAEDKLLLVGFDVNNKLTKDGRILDDLQDELYILMT